MRLLLDTHAFLWWLAGDMSLSERARAAVLEEGNAIFVSAASTWEIATKHRLGKLPGANVIAADLDGTIESQAFSACRSRLVMGKSLAPCLGRTAIRSTEC